MVSEPFYLKSDTVIQGINMGALLNKRGVRGDVGIEIEVEGNKFPKHAYEGRAAVHPEFIPPMWKYHRDGSLRGDDNAEYVFKAPLPFSEVPGAVTALFDMFTKYGSVLDDSNRTSVHVHLNMQKFHLNRLTSFLALYFSIEELLTAFCGDHRVGNLFCLRAKDATSIVSQLKRFIVSGGRTELHDRLHYAGLNANALHKFGSIEVRTLRGGTDPNLIIDWVSILERIYTLSADFPDPREIPGLMSSEGPEGFFQLVLGEKVGLVRMNIDYTSDDLRRAIYEGIRLAQDLCYCRDWSLYQPTEVKEDPFGRIKKSEDLSSPTGPGYLQGTVSVGLQPAYVPTGLNPTPVWAPIPVVHQPTLAAYQPQDVDFEPDPEFDDNDENEDENETEEDF